MTEVGFLPPNRSSTCKIEFEKLKHAFHRAIWPHVDHKMAMQVMDMWGGSQESDPSLAPISPEIVKVTRAFSVNFTGSFKQFASSGRQGPAEAVDRQSC